MFSASAVLPMEGRAARMTRSPPCRPPVIFVQLGEAGADALDALAGVEEGVDAALVVLEDLRRRSAGRS